MTCPPRPSALRVLTLLLMLALPCPSLLADDADDAENTEPFMLNLQQAELRSLIDTVSKRTGRNFIVDPRVDARVTVVSSEPVGDRELYDVFETVLSVHGYAAVDEGDVTKIVPSATAKQQAVPLVERGDRQGGIVTRVIAVENVSASQLVPILRPLLPQDAHLAAYEPTNRLILTDSAANIDRIDRIIARVDRPIDRDIDVIRLDHARAEEVVTVVQSLSQADEGATTRIAADTRTNSVLIRGGEATRLEMRTLVANLDTPVERDGNTRVVYLKYGNAEDMVSILEGVSQGQLEAEGEEDGSDQTVIQADENTNAVILTGTPDQLDGLESIIRKLDIRRAQVLVEAIIAELSTDRARELGVQFAVDGSEDDSAAGLTSFGDSSSNIVSIAANPESIGSGLSIGAVSDDAGETRFGVLLRALASDSDNNILSTPSLVTLDNQEAEIVVGQNVPFITGQFTGQEVGDTGGRSPFQTIERQDVGLTLKVKPQINEGNTVQMDIEQEVSNIAETAEAASDLVTNTRSLTTTVLIEDGQTLVLGGLIDDTVRTRQEKVPLLGDIPLLGRLFSYESTSTAKQNLMIFLQPRILRGLAEADVHTSEKYDMIRAEQMSRGERAPRFGAGEVPVLPELELEYANEGDS